MIFKQTNAGVGELFLCSYKKKLANNVSGKAYMNFESLNDLINH